MGWLAQHYRVRFEREIFSCSGYLAGDDARRCSELSRALAEPDVAAIFCARGGFGINRFAHQIDWGVLRAQPRWLVGFSDVTALHIEALAVGVASLHAPNVTGLGRGDQPLRQQMLDVLQTPRKERRFGRLTVLHPGHASGVLCGGNLALVHACATAGRLRLPDGAILFLEDVTERPYRIDRMLTTLLVGGHFDGVAAVVLGEMVRCAPGPDGVGVEGVYVKLYGELEII